MKKLSLLILLGLLTVQTAACSTSNSQGKNNVETTTLEKNNVETTTKTEYTMDELESILASIAKDFSNETEYLTSDEIKQQKEAIYENLSEKYNISYNSEITVRGKVLYSDDSNVFNICSTEARIDYYNDEDDTFDFNKLLPCEMNETDTRYIFLEENDNIVIKGVFKGNSLEDCKIISPEIAVPEFNNNVNYYCDEYDSLKADDLYRLVYGKVKKIKSLKNVEMTEYTGQNSKNNVAIYEAVQSSKYVITLTDDNDNELYWFTSQNISNISKGDSICVRSYVVGPLRVGQYSGLVYISDNFLNDTIDNLNYYIY